jgi:hypothetical protein
MRRSLCCSCSTKYHTFSLFLKGRARKPKCWFPVVFWANLMNLPSIQNLTKNGDLKVLFGKSHRRTNLAAFLFSNLG